MTSSAMFQMMRRSLRCAKDSHIARSHLFLASRAGLARGRFWPEAMSADVLVYDFQDGCRPGDDVHVSEGLRRSHKVFPGSLCSVRVKELDCESTGVSQEVLLLNQIRAAVSQPQVRWLQLPMCNTIGDVQRYKDIVNDVDPDWLEEHGRLQIICETPWCQKNLDDILTEHQDITGVVVGGGDYSRYAQMDLAKMTDLLRWDVLNACLRHGRFPIDSPTLGITTDSASHFEGGRVAGMRSSLVLHPSLVESCNSAFTPCPEKVRRMRDDIDQWTRSGTTGYRRNSGADFVGPPHLKQMVWESEYSAKIRSKPTFFQKYDGVLTAGLKRTIRTARGSGSLLDDVLPFLALGAATHPAHHRLVANLGSFSCKWGSAAMDTQGSLKPDLLDGPASVQTNEIHRRTTSTGKVIVTYEVDVFDKNHALLFSYVRKFLEEPDLFENMDVYGGTSKTAEEKAPSARRTGPSVASRTGAVVRETTVAAPGEEIHEQFCALLGYDAPLHHTTTEPPTIPSVLHLACHQIRSGVDEGGVRRFLDVDDVTYHAPLKPNQRCRSTVYVDVNGEKGSYVSILRAMDCSDNEGQILSSVFFRTKDELCSDYDTIRNIFVKPNILQQQHHQQQQQQREPPSRPFLSPMKSHATLPSQSAPSAM